MIAPAKTNVTLKYGATIYPYSTANPHAGVDFSYSPDSGIYAPESGKITTRAYMGDCGEAAELTAGANKHRFCHASRWLVTLGDSVTKGQKIGVMGQTGLAYGVHLHWILWVNGTRVDGLKYVNEGDEMTAEEKALYTKGQLFNAMKKLDEGTLVLEAVLDTVHVWDLATRPNYKSVFSYKKGAKFEVVSYIDDNATRYYVSAADGLNGKPYGVNRKDIKIVGPVGYVPYSGSALYVKK